MILTYCFLFFYSALATVIVKKNYNKDLSHSSFYKYIYIVVILGILIRFYNISSLPGLQIDEAMAGYDSWSIANFGTDSALNHLPVYLLSYGTGQSALYAYLSIPFIKLFGLTIIAIRLAMLNISAITIIFLLWTLLHIKLSKKLTFSIIFLIAINPWHIMVSRFGLDANLAPHFILLATCFLLLGIYEHGKRRTIYYLCAVIFLGLTSYAYVASWYVLPIFLIGLLVYLLKQNFITKIQCLVLSLTLIVIVSPMLFFAYIQFFKQESIIILGFTFPKLIGTQVDGQTILGSPNLISALLNNLKGILSMVFNGKDGLIFNSLTGFGMIYNLAGILLFGIGIKALIKEKSPLSYVTAIWFLATIPLLLITSPLVHHWNIIVFPTIIIMAYGLTALWRIDFNHLFKPVFICFVLFFSAFVFSYNSIYRYELRNSSYMAPTTLNDTILVAKNKKLKTIYVNRDSLNQAAPNEFIYFRFFDPISPTMWQETRDTPYDLRSNLTSKNYHNYVFYSDDENIEDTGKNIGYIFQKGNDSYSEHLKGFEIYQNEEYVLFYKK